MKVNLFFAAVKPGMFNRVFGAVKAKLLVQVHEVPARQPTCPSLLLSACAGRCYMSERLSLCHHISRQTFPTLYV